MIMQWIEPKSIKQIKRMLLYSIKFLSTIQKRRVYLNISVYV